MKSILETTKNISQNHTRVTVQQNDIENVKFPLLYDTKRRINLSYSKLKVSKIIMRKFQTLEDLSWNEFVDYRWERGNEKLHQMDSFLLEKWEKEEGICVVIKEL